jgi:hypothetical protein
MTDEKLDSSSNEDVHETGTDSKSEQEAKQFGWVPKEDFKGDPEQWRDADTFLQRGKEINGFLRKDLEKLEVIQAKKDAAHAAELLEIRATMEEFKEFHNMTLDATYKRAVADLRKEKAEAIEQGDGARVVELDDEIDKIKEAQKPAQKEKPKNDSPQANDKAYYEWLDDNQWYITNETLGKAAEKYGEIINAKTPDLKGKPFLDEVVKRVKEAFPDVFENPNRKLGSTSDSSDSGTRDKGSKNKQSYENLPPEGKAQCDKFIKQGIFKTREAYCAELDWS